MNSREPDRIPIDFDGHRSSGISAIVYARLKEALGITSVDIYVYDMIQQVHNILSNVPAKNIIKMFDTVHSNR